MKKILGKIEKKFLEKTKKNSQKNRRKIIGKMKKILGKTKKNSRKNRKKILGKIEKKL